MPCPKCGSNNLWDDNLAWGCNRCDFFSTGDVRNSGSPYDFFPQDQHPTIVLPKRVFERRAPAPAAARPAASSRSSDAICPDCGRSFYVQELCDFGSSQHCTENSP